MKHYRLKQFLLFLSFFPFFIILGYVSTLSSDWYEDQVGIEDQGNVIVIDSNKAGGFPVLVSAKDTSQQEHLYAIAVRDIPDFIQRFPEHSFLLNKSFTPSELRQAVIDGISLNKPGYSGILDYSSLEYEVESLNDTTQSIFIRAGDTGSDPRIHYLWYEATKDAVRPTSLKVSIPGIAAIFLLPISFLISIPLYIYFFIKLKRKRKLFELLNTPQV